MPTLSQRLAPTPAFAFVLVTLELSLSWQWCFRHVIALWQHLSAFALACQQHLTATLTTLPATAAIATLTPPPALSTPPTPLPANTSTTESAHREALVKLQKMHETMEFMEQERAEMVTEVKAQIKKALASMAVDIDDSDKYDSWPGSHLSSQLGGRLLRPSSRTSHLHRTSDAGMRKQLRSFSTECRGLCPRHPTSRGDHTRNPQAHPAQP